MPAAGAKAQAWELAPQTSQRAVLGSAGRGQDLNRNPAGIDHTGGWSRPCASSVAGLDPQQLWKQEGRRPRPRPGSPGSQDFAKAREGALLTGTRKRSHIWLQGGNQVSKPEAGGCAAAGGKEPGARGPARRGG